MAPVVESFPVSDLATRAQYVANGKRRKPPVDLKDCEPKEMLAFNCDLNGPQSDVRSRIKCESIMRTFRVCSNKFTVETTEWEGVWDR